MMMAFYIGFVIVLLILSSLTVYAVIIYKKALELNPYTRKIDELKSKITAFQITAIKLEEELRNLNKQKQEAEEIIKKKDAAHEYLDNHEELINKFQREDAELKEQIQETINEFENLKQEFYDKTAEKNELLKELEKLQINLEGGQNKLDNILNEIKEAKAELQAKKDNIDRLKDEEQLIRNLINELMPEVENLKHEKERLNKDINELKNSIDERRNSISSMENRINDYQTKLASLETEIRKSQLSDQLIAKEVDSEKWSDLDRPVIDTTKQRPKQSVKENQWLDAFKSNLKRNDIYFNDRVINAFHTSLKIGDKSPLVVLAGISGTGKSLLPQLYATAMGMNYLNVAVQPRWDSPQDMLGFYNYMQNKYKATELSRMLWQFDIYNNAEAHQRYKGDAGNLPMNLVLLDEMNLAKVEYYFSDMLSKLEVRRTINPENIDQRCKAEIEIECASLSAKNSSRRLFINNNILFVGTMNEDETTQSLSDKVIDRSNMLRFGKPKKLQTNSRTQEFMGLYDSNDFITLNEWKEFNADKQLSINNTKKLNEIVDSINNSLEEVGRPFAHRVYQSIQGYVAAYPNANDDTNAFNHAIADQIEMKILPKLNGLEKSNSEVSKVLHNLRYPIEETKDKELIEEYNKAIQDNDSDFFFKWKGVVRS